MVRVRANALVSPNHNRYKLRVIRRLYLWLLRLQLGLRCCCMIIVKVRVKECRYENETYEAINYFNSPGYRFTHPAALWLGLGLGIGLGSSRKCLHCKIISCYHSCNPKQCTNPNRKGPSNTAVPVNHSFNHDKRQITFKSLQPHL